MCDSSTHYVWLIHSLYNSSIYLFTQYNDDDDDWLIDWLNGYDDNDDVNDDINDDDDIDIYDDVNDDVNDDDDEINDGDNDGVNNNNSIATGPCQSFCYIMWSWIYN